MLKHCYVAARPMDFHETVGQTLPDMWLTALYAVTKEDQDYNVGAKRSLCTADQSALTQHKTSPPGPQQTNKTRLCFARSRSRVLIFI